MDGLLEDEEHIADEVHDRVHAHVDSIIDALERPLTRKTAGPVAAQLALVLRYRLDFFNRPFEDKHEMPDEKTRSARVVAGVRANRAVLDEVAPEARALLDQICVGKVDRDPAVRPLLRAKHARAYLQELADGETEPVDTRDISPSDVRLDLLVLISPYVELPVVRMKRWLAAVRDEGGDDDRATVRISACKKLLKRARAAAEATD